MGGRKRHKAESTAFRRPSKMLKSKSRKWVRRRRGQKRKALLGIGNPGDQKERSFETHAKSAILLEGLKGPGDVVVSALE
jgi:hypothetical protein